MARHPDGRRGGIVGGMAWISGVLGAVAAVLYINYVDKTPLPPAIWSIPTRLIFAAAGFVIGWVVGFALSRTGFDKW